MSLWDRVVTPDGRRGRVVCFLEEQACVWHGFGEGETWHLTRDLRPAEPKQGELFDAD